MSMRLRSKSLVLVASGVIAFGIYLVMDRSLALRGYPAPQPNETIELREYGMLPAPPSRKTIEGFANWVIWRVRNPAQARFLAAAKRLEARAPNQERALQEAFLALGYEFPPGCHAVYKGNSLSRCWWISHYPSVLQSMESRLRLTPRWRMLLDLPAPNPTVQRAGASRFAGESSQRTVAAGSGR